MNAMSVSPVKPTINPGNHAVPATATNLTKSPLLAPINLIPETKPIPAVNAVPANTENSVDLCSKPPTSNGIVSSIPETNSKENSTDVPQNHNEKSITAENLSTTNAPPKPLEAVSEVKSVEKSKPEEPKSTTPLKENSESVKENTSTAIGESVKEPVKDVKPVTEEKKIEPPVNDVKDVKENESHQTESKTSETNSEPVPEPKTESSSDTKSTSDKAKEQKNQESEANNEKDTEAGENETDSALETTPAPKHTKRKAKQPIEPVEDDGKEGRKSKRVRLPTQPYQSPIPELQFIAKLQTPAKPAPKSTTEKIIAFFRNEFLAVRNPEGSFYICQTFQNIHRSSSRIKIRWFTNLPNDEFTPDFCDLTEFDCILTNVQMTRVEKDRWKLPAFERTRIENILKRALDVEKGLGDNPSITEEHPDGLDLSLFKDEAQLKKKKKKSASPKVKKEKAAASGVTKKPKTKKPAKAVAAAPATASTKKSARLSNQSQTVAKETATEKSKPAEKKKDKKKNKGKQGAGTKASPNTKQNDKTKVWEPSVKSSNSSKVILSLKKEAPPAPSKTPTAATTKAATKRTSSVSSRASATSTSPATTVPQKRRKDEPKAAAANQAATNERTGKVRNAGSAVAAKINSAAMRTTKEKERKVSNASSQRKK